MEDHFMNEALAISDLTFDFPAKEEGAIISIPQVFRSCILRLVCISSSHLIRNHLWTHIVDPFLFICPQPQLLFRPIHLQKKIVSPNFSSWKKSSQHVFWQTNYGSAHGELGRILYRGDDLVGCSEKFLPGGKTKELFGWFLRGALFCLFFQNKIWRVMFVWTIFQDIFTYLANLTLFFPF